jgi:hypothetical protein
LGRVGNIYGIEVMAANGINIIAYDGELGQ